MKITGPIALALAALATATPGGAADFSDPTWPCIQRKVENLSPGLMWPLPLDADATIDDPATAHDVADLAERLALRRVPLEDLAPRIEDFAARHDGDATLLGQVFVRAFDSLSTRRTRIIKGIGDFSLGQIALAERIDAARLDMDTEMAKNDPDFDKVDALEEQLDWDQVIYSDRQRSITYLCETPTLLEKRLFAIAQMLQQQVRDGG